MGPETGDFTAHLVPHVVIGGFGPGDKPSKELPVPEFPIDTIQLAPTGVGEIEAANLIKEKLLSKSQDSQEWIPNAITQTQILRFSQAEALQISRKVPRPSPLSPRNPKSSLYPDKVLNVQWVQKYLYYLPTTVMAWFKMTHGGDGDAFLVRQINELRENLASQRVNLLVVLVGGIEQGELLRRAASIRKETGLAPRTGLVTMSPDMSISEIDLFVETTWQTLSSQAADFFASRSREVRHKRNQLTDPETDTLWEVRFTFKLAAFAEFKNDMHGALRLYESTYDVILVLFENLSPQDSEAWRSARQVLDVTAAKIFKIALYLSQFAGVYRKFNHHVRTVAKILDDKGLSSQGKSFIAWRAQWTYILGQLTEASKKSFGEPWWAVSPLSRPNDPPISSLPRSGLLFMEAARLSQLAESMDDAESGDKKDAYASSPTFAVKEAYESALADLSGKPQSKSVVLLRLGEFYAKNGDKNAAVYHFKQAASLAPHTSSVFQMANERVVSLSEDSTEKLASQLSLLLAPSPGAAKLPSRELDLAGQSYDIGALEVPLFKATGMFDTDRTFIGRKVSTQVTITPLFQGELTLDSIKVQTTAGSVSITNDDSKLPVELANVETSETANLTFSKGRSLALQLSIRPTESSDLEFVDVQLYGSRPSFSQRLIPSISDHWLEDRSGRLVQRHIRVHKQKFVEVDTRPALVTVDTSRIKRLVAPREKLSLSVPLVSNEDVTSHVKLKVAMKFIATDKSEQLVKIAEKAADVAAGQTELVPLPEFQAPGKAFRLTLVVEYTTENDQLTSLSESYVDIELMKPFRVAFELRPELHPEAWPSVFVPLSCLEPVPKIRRRWMLSGKVLGLSESPIIVHNGELTMESERASVILMGNRKELGTTIGHNESVKIEYYFETVRKDKDVRSFEAEAVMSVEWSRPETPEVRNVYEVPAIKLNLPNQEPRVLAAGQTDYNGDVSIRYYIENATSRILTFAVSMSSSPHYVFEGMKATTIRMMPYSRRSISYKFKPLGHGSGQPLPELRVFDTVYKRALAILPGTDFLYADQGNLKVAERPRSV